MSGGVPPGWPAGVPPRGVDGFEEAAAAWLLDLCPPDYRAHAVLRRHLLVLAVVAGHHVAAQLAGGRRAVAVLRTSVAGEVGVDVVERALEALDTEHARLLAAARGVALLEEALRDRRRG